MVMPCSSAATQQTLFSGGNPKGWCPFSRISALLVAHLAMLNHAPRALNCTKTVTSGGMNNIETASRNFRLSMWSWNRTASSDWDLFLDTDSVARRASHLNRRRCVGGGSSRVDPGVQARCSQHISAAYLSGNTGWCAGGIWVVWIHPERQHHRRHLVGDCCRSGCYSHGIVS